MYEHSADQTFSGTTYGSRYRAFEVAVGLCIVGNLSFLASHCSLRPHR